MIRSPIVITWYQVPGMHTRDTLACPQLCTSTIAAALYLDHSGAVAAHTSPSDERRIATDLAASKRPVIASNRRRNE